MQFVRREIAIYFVNLFLTDNRKPYLREIHLQLNLRNPHIRLVFFAFFRIITGTFQFLSAIITGTFQFLSAIALIDRHYCVFREFIGICITKSKNLSGIFFDPERMLEDSVWVEGF
jgi:hypothetical protein